MVWTSSQAAQPIQIQEPPIQVGGLEKGVPFIGVALHEGEGGVQIPNVYPKTPAELSGLKGQDVILLVDGEETASIAALIEQIRSHRYGEVAVLSVKRGEKALRGLVPVRGHDISFEEERAHAYASPTFGLVKGSLTVPELPSMPAQWMGSALSLKGLKGRLVLMVCWSEPDQEAQAFEWLEGLAPLASSSLTVVGWNGAGTWSVNGKKWAEAKSQRFSVASESFERWGQEMFVPFKTAWCYMLDEKGLVRGFLPYSHREFLVDLGHDMFHQAAWAQALERSWLSRMELALEDAQEGIRVIQTSASHGNELKVGDLLMKMEGIAVKSSAEVIAELKAYTPGTALTVEVLRDGRPARAKLTIK